MLLFLCCIFLVTASSIAQKADKYTDENRPYKFGFNIQGHQHRKEEKDEKGIIHGEYGFITADGYYRVTVYATDENGDFKILSMKNYYVGFPPEDPTTTPPPPARNYPPKPVQPYQPPPSKPQPTPKPFEYPPVKQEQRLPTTTEEQIGFHHTPPPATTKKVQGISGCSHCLIPTTSTTARAPTKEELGIVDKNPKQKVPLMNLNMPSKDELGINLKRPKPAVEPEQPTKDELGINHKGKPHVDVNPKPNRDDLGINLKGKPNVEVGGKPNRVDLGINLKGLPNVGVTDPLERNVGKPNRDELGIYLKGKPNVEVGEEVMKSRGGFGEEEGKTFGPFQGSRPFQGAARPFQGGVQQPGGGPIVQGIKKLQEKFGSFKPKQNDAEASPERQQKIGEVHDGLPPGVTVDDVKQLLYTFNYTVGFHGHHEDGYRNGDKKGDYFVDGRDGKERRVEYIANEFGYQPNITFVDLDENDVRKPKEETEKEHGLRGYEFKWFYRR